MHSVWSIFYRLDKFKLHMKLLSLTAVFALLFSLTVYSQHKDSVYIGLKDGTTLKAKNLTYKTPIFSRSYLLLNDTTKIEASTVRYYQDRSGYYLNASTAKSGREEFYKRDVSGKISIYSKTYVSDTYNPSFGTPGANYGNSWSHSRRVVELMQKDGSSELLPLTYNNLYKLTSDNVECLPLLKKIKSLSRASTYSYVGGIALFIAGGIQMISDNNRNTESGNHPVSYNPVMIVGAGIGFLPWIFNSSKREKIKKTLDIYNSY